MSHRTKAALLSLLLFICGAGFVVTQKLREHVLPPAPRELFAIVNEQLAALQAADYLSAYRHAATGVQQRFTVPQFEKMMRQRYPEMARHYRVEYGEVKVHGTSAAVQVYLLAGDGSFRSFLYSLTHEEGRWKFDNVEEVRAPRVLDRLAGSRA